MRYHFLISTLLFCFCGCLTAQDTGNITEQTIIEGFIESIDAEQDFNFSDLYDNLSYYYKRQLNINKASYEELSSSYLFTPIESQAIVNHRDLYGDFINLLELQSIGVMNLSAIKRVLPFISIGNESEIYQADLKTLFTQGDQEIILRYDRVLEQKEGFLRNDEDPTDGYLGDPGRVFLRYRYQYEQNLSFGFTAEKDPGEEFFTGKNSKGFDFYSGHLFARDIIPRIKTIALGDYYARLGQGLILNNGFAAGKSAFTTDIKRGGYSLRPYRSVTENLYFRGVASEIKIAGPLQALLIYSDKKRDGNGSVSARDSNLVSVITSLQLSGNHRTASEIEDKLSVRERIVAAALQYDTRKLHISAQYVQTNYDQPLERSERPANLFNWAGDQLQNVGVDYSTNIRNLHFYGEWAHSIDGGNAFLQGLSLSIGNSVQLVTLYRNFDRNYWSAYSAPFAESTTAINEEGIYTGIRWQAHKRWTFSAYADYWHNDWLRFGVDAPRDGVDYFGRLQYYVKRKTEIYIQYRNRARTTTPPTETAAIKPTAIERRHQFRIHFRHQFSKALEWRHRAECSWYSENDTRSNGIMVYNDIIYRPLGSNLSFTARYALFDTDDFDSRIYAYENDILNAYSIPAFSGTGTRYYINLRYRPLPKLTMEFRYENLHVQDVRSVGSGLESIQGNTRSRIKTQLVYRF